MTIAHGDAADLIGHIEIAELQWREDRIEAGRAAGSAVGRTASGHRLAATALAARPGHHAIGPAFGAGRRRGDFRQETSGP